MKFKSVSLMAALLILGAVCIGANRAQAVLVNGIFQAKVNDTPENVAALADLGSIVSIGDVFNGTFQYESSTPVNSGDSTAANYLAITDFSFTGTHSSSGFADNSGGSNIQVYNNLGGEDFISFVPFAGDLSVPDLDGHAFMFAVLRMNDPTATNFSTALSLPTSLQLPDFSGGGEFDLFFEGEQDLLGIGMTLTALRTLPHTDGPVVPEPATLSLIGMGMAGLGAMRHRRATAA